MVIVVSVYDTIGIDLPAYGSPLERGYDLIESKLSIAHLKLTAPLSNITPSPIPRLCVPIVRSNKPVAGSYDASVGVNCWSAADAPTSTVIVFEVTPVIARVLPYAGWLTAGK